MLHFNGISMATMTGAHYGLALSLPQLLQEVPSPDEAYIAAMRGSQYPPASLQQQQLNSGSYAAASMQQQQLRHVSPYLAANVLQQQAGVNGLGYGIGGVRQQGMQQQHSQARQNVPGSMQNQQAMQPTPDRLGITPMQLAMLQQQRLQQGQANRLVVTPSIHSVTSSNRSWSEEQ